MTLRLAVKNWNEFQHYKDRLPTWIKLHKALLDDFEYQCLPVASRALAPMLWLLASENIDGEFDGDLKKLSFRLRASESEIEAGLKPLIDSGFFVIASGVLAERYQDACPEKRREEERRTSAFAEFWEAYPKKKNKGDAEKAFKKIKVTSELLDQMLACIDASRSCKDWTKDGGQYIPYPASWLNAKGWEDENNSDDIFAGAK